MQSDNFLPQYAAQAVIDLEKTARLAKSVDKQYAATHAAIAVLIRAAVHVVLPPNGEIYRSNRYGGAKPSDDECLSFAGLPAPVTCFEYPWNHDAKPGVGDVGRKRITVVFDDKQHYPVGTCQPDGASFTSKVFSVFYSDKYKMWALYQYALGIANPLYVIDGPKRRGDWDWNVKAACWNVSSNRLLGADGGMADADEMGKAISECRADIGAVVQCCHALRAGASFEEKNESSATRRWKFDKRGVGGFTYHVLKLPTGSSGNRSSSGEHDSPRFHVRRAHIRKLPTGVLTFVRQCFVGDADKGVVHKSYQVNEAKHG